MEKELKLILMLFIIVVLSGGILIATDTESFLDMFKEDNSSVQITNVSYKYVSQKNFLPVSKVNFTVSSTKKYDNAMISISLYSDNKTFIGWGDIENVSIERHQSRDFVDIPAYILYEEDGTPLEYTEGSGNNSTKSYSYADPEEVPEVKHVIVEIFDPDKRVEYNNNQTSESGLIQKEHLDL